MKKRKQKSKIGLFLVVWFLLSIILWGIGLVTKPEVSAIGCALFIAFILFSIFYLIHKARKAKQNSNKNPNV